MKKPRRSDSETNASFVRRPAPQHANRFAYSAPAVEEELIESHAAARGQLFLWAFLFAEAMEQTVLRRENRRAALKERARFLDEHYPKSINEARDELELLERDSVQCATNNTEERRSGAPITLTLEIEFQVAGGHETHSIEFAMSPIGVLDVRCSGVSTLSAPAREPKNIADAQAVAKKLVRDAILALESSAPQRA